ncbi:LysR family transcriptional regulator [Ligilactobacillus saerimneri]|uniref:LysR family transcriptional regulator n=1 Tax=Ligilactobacillus saerimneri TaxID=228229 RepID=A0A7H9ELV5_9LACO|nr:LysR family transcriptional regulator [Ligilactobacillus saerimneri]QLL78471.1 LysR family transcriptional regulator [Ligilactobacillus saerimneri]
MDTRILRYFLVVAETNNITQAAQRLHLTQPTLSRQIQELERLVGRPLFDRNNHHLQLNAAGLLFCERAQVILDLLDHAQKEIQTSSDQLVGTINLGLVESAVTPWLMSQIDQFQVQHPRVKFALFAGDGDSLRPRLDQGQDDFAALIEPVETAKYHFFRLPITEEWGVLMRQDDPLAQQDSITPAQLASLPLIMGRRSIVRDNVAEALSLSSNRLNVKITTNLPGSLSTLLLTGNYYHLGIRGVAEQIHDAQLTFVPLSPRTTSAHLLVWKKQRSLAPAARAFLHFLTNVTPK